MGTLLPFYPKFRQPKIKKTSKNHRFKGVAMVSSLLFCVLVVKYEAFIFLKTAIRNKFYG